LVRNLTIVVRRKQYNSGLKAERIKQKAKDGLIATTTSKPMTND